MLLILRGFALRRRIKQLITRYSIMSSVKIEHALLVTLYPN